MYNLVFCEDCLGCSFISSLWKGITLLSFSDSSQISFFEQNYSCEGCEQDFEVKILSFKFICKHLFANLKFSKCLFYAAVTGPVSVAVHEHNILSVIFHFDLMHICARKMLFVRVVLKCKACECDGDRNEGEAEIGMEVVARIVVTEKKTIMRYLL